MDSSRSLRFRLDALAERRSRREALFSAVAEGTIPSLQLGSALEATAQRPPRNASSLPFELRESPSGAAYYWRRVVASTLHASAHTQLGPRMDTVALRAPYDSTVLPLLMGKKRALLGPEPPIAFIDIETSGLAGGAGTVAFLVGIGFWERCPDPYPGWQFVLEQFFASDFDEEAGVIEAACARLESFTAFCTYNGRSFDIPLLRTRAIMHRISSRLFQRPNLDLLPICRRLWRDCLASCSLKAIERGVLHLDRGPDIDSALIPECWFEAARSGNQRLLLPVIHHHAQDIVSMGSLLWLVTEILGDPLGHNLFSRAEEWGGLARWLSAEKRDADAYEALARAHSLTPPGEAWRRSELRAQQARLLRRLSRLEEALAAWRELTQGPEPLASIAIIEIAKLLEHCYKRPQEALAWVEQQERRLRGKKELAQWLDRPLAEETLLADLARRRERLQRRALRRRCQAA